MNPLAAMWTNFDYGNIAKQGLAHQDSFGSTQSSESNTNVNNDHDLAKLLNSPNHFGFKGYSYKQPSRSYTDWTQNSNDLDEINKLKSQYDFAPCSNAFEIYYEDSTRPQR